MAARKKTKKKSGSKPTKKTRSGAKALSKAGRPRLKTSWRKQLQAKKEPARRRADSVLAERLVDIRQHHGLTQIDVAKGTGIPFESYSNYERAEVSPPFWRVCQLAIYHGVSLDYLAGRTNELKRKKTARKAAKKGSTRKARR